LDQAGDERTMLAAIRAALDAAASHIARRRAIAEHAALLFLPGVAASRRIIGNSPWHWMGFLPDKNQGGIPMVAWRSGGLV
jgi:hypothetical protein